MKKCKLCDKEAHWAFRQYDHYTQQYIEYPHCLVHKTEHIDWSFGKWVPIDWPNKLPKDSQVSSYGALKAM